MIHSHHTDVLPKDHPLAHKLVVCGKCKELVHADNNECMRTWIEWGPAILCARCALPHVKANALRYAAFALDAGVRVCQ